MFGILTDLVSNVVKIVATPVVLVATVANAAVAPIADTVAELAKDVKEAL